MGFGKKVGKFGVETVLAEYNLDVRLDIASNDFTILVPDTPGGVVSTKRGDFNCKAFQSTVLEEVKQAVKKFLYERDQTEFVDVIEYNYEGMSGNSRGSHWGSTNNFIGFDFRVARISVATDRNGRSKLEIPIDVDGEGGIRVQLDITGKPHSPQSHSWNSYPMIVAFTIDRWKKCCAIRDGIIKIDKLLFELLGEGGSDTELKLDAVGSNPLLLPSKQK